MIKYQEKWNKWVEANKDDGYGNACVDVAREVMRLLDTPEYQEFNPHSIICDADENVQADGITGFMAGCVAQMVTQCHSRGEEFKVKWNKQYDDKPREGVINPALLILKDKNA